MYYEVIAVFVTDKSRGTLHKMHIRCCSY